MIRILSSARALLALSLASLAAASALAGTVTGTIRSAATQVPLASKVVAAYDTAGTLRASATSDPTGKYVLSLPAGSYRLLAYDLDGVYATMFDADAESFETTPPTSVPDSGTVRRDFALVTGGSVTGTIVQFSGGAVAGAVVEAYNLSGTRRGFTTTNAQGRYSLVLPPGEYKLVAYEPSGELAFNFFPGVRTFEEAGRVAVAAARMTTADFRLERAARLSGIAVDDATGTPLGGIVIYAYTTAGALVTTTTTDAAGAFRFSLPSGTYRFAAGDPARRYAPAFLGGGRAFATSEVVSVTAPGSVANLLMSLARGATITGRVRDAAGAPVANVTAAAYNVDGTLHATATTNAEGTYELLVAPGAYKLAVFDAQLVYATAFFGGTRDFAGSGPIGIAAGQALRGFDVTIGRGGRVSGTVREGATPRGGITVAAYDAAGVLAGSATTAADGTYALVAAPGDYRLVAFDPTLRYTPAYDQGAASFDQTVPRTIASGASVSADFALRRGITVSGDVVDASGQRVSGVNVFALDDAGNRVAGGTSANGTFSLSVPAGTYRFVAIDPEHRYAITYFEQAATLAAARPVSVSDTQTPRLRFTLERTTRRRAVR